ncbi:MAG TPA: hypothetical protein VGI70_09365, partial [Polyangiales bacterium]
MATRSQRARETEHEGAGDIGFVPRKTRGQDTDAHRPREIAELRPPAKRLPTRRISLSTTPEARARQMKMILKFNKHASEGPSARAS